MRIHCSRLADLVRLEPQHSSAMEALLSVPSGVSGRGRCVRRLALTTRLAEPKLSHFGHFQPPPVRSLTAAATNCACKRTRNMYLHCAVWLRSAAMLSVRLASVDVDCCASSLCLGCVRVLQLTWTPCYPTHALALATTRAKGVSLYTNELAGETKIRDQEQPLASAFQNPCATGACVRSPCPRAPHARATRARASLAAHM